MASTKAFTIILVIVGGFVGVFIIVQGSGFFQLAARDAEATYVPTFQCLDFVYSVEDPLVEGNSLQFTVQNKNYAKLAIPGIVVKVGNITQDFETPTLVQGKWQRFTAEWEQPVERFSVYVPGCEVYAEVCRIAGGECQ